MSMAPPYMQVMDDLLKGQEFATQLHGLLRDTPKAELLTDQILRSFSRAIRAVDTAKAAAAAGEGSEVQSEVTCGAGGGKRKAAPGGGDRRGACRRRTQQSSGVTVTLKSLDDGQAWRKYGQKEIQNSKHPKAYFRCTHKYDQQCAAQRQVQRCDEDPDTFRVTYIGVHTCRDPAAVAPHVIHQTSADVLHAGSRLISFAPNASAVAATPATTTSTTTTTTTANTNQAEKDAAPGSVLQSLKQEGGEQEEVLSSLTPGSSSVRDTAAVATAAGPDQGDVTSTLHSYGDGLDLGGLLDDYPSWGLEDFLCLDH